MPELPEVQTIADDLNRKVVGTRIVSFWTDWPKSIKYPLLPSFKKQIKGLKIQKVERVGKNVLFHLSTNKALLVHQKMTGHLMVGKWDIKKGKAQSLLKGALEERVNQYIHAIWGLDNGYQIALSDMRKFAKIIFGEKEKVFEVGSIHQLGPDALDPKLSFKEFQKIINRRTKSIKQTLMDPSVIAGIGNIYADDILWRAKIHPARPSNSIKNEELKKIFSSMKFILKKAVKLRGSSVGGYRDASGKPGRYGEAILVYRRTGEPCKRCRSKIKRIKLGQRSAHFCPQCQKK